MNVTEVAEIYAKGFMGGRQTAGALVKAIEAAILYVKPETENGERALRQYLLRQLENSRQAMEVAQSNQLIEAVRDIEASAQADDPDSLANAINDAVDIAEELNMKLACMAGSQERAKNELFAFLRRTGVPPREVMNFNNECPVLWELLQAEMGSGLGLDRTSQNEVATAAPKLKDLLQRVVKEALDNPLPHDADCQIVDPGSHANSCACQFCADLQEAKGLLDALNPLANVQNPKNWIKDTAPTEKGFTAVYTHPQLPSIRILERANDGRFVALEHKEWCGDHLNLEVAVRMVTDEHNIKLLRAREDQSEVDAEEIGSEGPR